MDFLDRTQNTWGAWPIAAPNSEAYVLEALRSRRWAISSLPSENSPQLFEQRLASRYANYLQVPSVVPTDHGSSALVVALLALQLPEKSHVIVPALTWVATATAVLRAGHVPVVCDVDPLSGNMASTTLRHAITNRTRAVIIVHWACTMADMDELLGVTSSLGISVIEDAAQAHGAAWRGVKAGCLGDFGCFSFQQGKVLSAGEGGAVVSRLGSRQTLLEELRADSRSWRSGMNLRPGDMALAETAGSMGFNFGLGDLAAALACAQLEVLDEQHEIRNANYWRLLEECDNIPGISVPRPLDNQTMLSLYEIPFRVAAAKPGETARLANRVRLSTGIRAYLPRPPLVGSALLQPDTIPSIGSLASEFRELHAHRSYPAATAIAQSCFKIHHGALLATESEMDVLIATLTSISASRSD